MNKKLTILHLSDLHFRSSQEFDRSVVLEPLLTRLAKDRKSGIKPEIIIISGDIAFSGKAGEYSYAASFFKELLTVCNLHNKQLFIVPGNHDVDRVEYRPSDCPKYTDMQVVNTELENENYRNDLLKGLRNYFSFIHTHYPHIKPVYNNLIPFIVSYSALCGKEIGLVGLNSAWMCRKANADPGCTAIGEYQVKTAFTRLQNAGKTDVTICITHHPLSWLWEDDRRILRQYLNNTILLTGHMHTTEGMFSHDLEGRFYHFQAGGAYLDKGSADPWPSRFHYITLDWDKNIITLEFRKFLKEKRRWVLDADTGDDGTKVFPGFGSRVKGIEEYETLHGSSTSRFSDYLKYALGEYRHIPSCGFETTFRHPIKLEQVYINLHAHIGSIEYPAKGKEKLESFYRREQLSSMDIKGAFKALRTYDVKDMILLGDPGSGKTTLLKYILIMIVLAKAEAAIGVSSTLVPFFIPLRKWKPGMSDFYELANNACLLSSFAVSDKIFYDLCRNGKALLLFDGLDEAGDKNKRNMLIAWLEKVRKSFPGTHCIFTSRFAGYTGTGRFTGNILELSILDFTNEQIQAFLTGWFSAVEEALHPGDQRRQEKAKNDARELIDRILQSR